MALAAVCALGCMINTADAECTATRLNLSPLSPPDRYTVAGFATSATSASPIIAAATATQLLRRMNGRTGDVLFEAGAFSPPGAPSQAATAVPVETARFQRIDAVAFVPAARSSETAPSTSVVVADAGVVKYVQLRSGGAVVDLGLYNSSRAGTAFAVAVSSDRTLLVADATQACVISTTLLDDAAYAVNMTGTARGTVRVAAGVCGSLLPAAVLVPGGSTAGAANATRIGSPVSVAAGPGDGTVIIATAPPTAQLLRVGGDGLMSALGPPQDGAGLPSNATVTALSTDGALFATGRGAESTVGAVSPSDARLLSGPHVEPFVRAVCGAVRGVVALHPAPSSGGGLSTMEGVLAFATDGGFFGFGDGCDDDGTANESASNDQIMLIAIVCFFGLLVIVVGGTVVFKRIRRAQATTHNPPPVTRHGKIPDAIVAGEPQYRQRDGSLAPSPDFGSKRTAPRFAAPPKRSAGDAEMTDLRGQ